MKKRKIVFIGSGNITQSIVSGLINSNYPPNLITVCSPSIINSNILVKKYKVNSNHSNIHGSHNADVIIFAIKPKHLNHVCNELYNKIDFSNKILISLIAGVNLNKIKELLGNRDINLVRIMTNINCYVNNSMSGIYTSSDLNQHDKIFITELMSKLGKVIWLNCEEDINIIVAASSSAPAYFFLFMEIIEQKVKSLGFSQDVAHSIVLQTAFGSIKFAKQYSNYSFSDLRKKVTSKNGTTNSAINVFNKFKLNKIIDDAMQATIIRAKEIENSFYK